MSAAAPAAAVSPTPRHRRNNRRRTSWRGRLAASSSAPASTSGRDGPSSSRETTATAERENGRVLRGDGDHALVPGARARVRHGRLGHRAGFHRQLGGCERGVPGQLPRRERLRGARRRNVEHLSSVETLDARFGGADVWTLSPPCQPYTRKEAPTATTLARARSRGSSRPYRSYERRPNGSSSTSSALRAETSERVAALDEAGYVWREYHASPVDIGVPCTRTRYYALAKRKPLSRRVRRGAGLLRG